MDKENVVSMYNGELFNQARVAHETPEQGTSLTGKRELPRIPGGDAIQRFVQMFGIYSKAPTWILLGNPPGE